RAHPAALAVCCLVSFRNADHQAAVATALRRKGLLVSVSHEILPEFREVERTSTTVVNAYLAPVMSAYLRATQSQASTVWNTAWNRKSKNAVQVRVMQSNGGIISAEGAAVQPVRTVMSGPVGGVLGAGCAASLAGLVRAISLDHVGCSSTV